MEKMEISCVGENEIIESRFSQSHASRLAEYITGLKIDDPALLERLKTDQEIIRAKYKLPNRKMRFDEPAEYERILRNTATNLGVEIRPRSECGQFFQKHGYAGAVSFSKDKLVGVDIKRQIREDYVASLADLEHELIHAEQEAQSPGMPIELREYEAYLATMSMVFLENNPDSIEEILFDFYILGSVKHWYRKRSEEQQKEIKPDWDDAKFFLKNVDHISEDSLRGQVR